MGACDHPFLVEERLRDSSGMLRAGACKGVLGDSLGEGCTEAALEQHLCSEFTPQSTHEQRPCSEVTYAISNSNGDPGDARDAYPGLSVDYQLRTSVVKRDGRVGEACLGAEVIPHSDCGVGGLCLHGSHVESEGLCSEKGGLSKGCEIPFEFLTINDSQSNCIEQNVQKDSNCVDGVALERDSEVADEKNDVLDGLNLNMCNEILFSLDCEMPMEFLQMDGLLSSCAQQNEHNHTKSINGLAMERKHEVDTHGRIFPSQGFEIPLEILHMVNSPSNSAQHEEQDNNNAPSAESASKVVVEKSGIHAYSQNLHSQSCSTPMVLNNMDVLTNFTDQHGKEFSNFVNGSSAKRVTEVVEEKIVDACSQMFISQGCQLASGLSHRISSLSDWGEQNGQKSNSIVNGHSAERLMEFMEEKSDVLDVVGFHTDTHILHSEENLSNLKEQTSDIASDHANAKSVFLQSCQPSGVVDNGPFKSSGILGVDVSTSGLNSSLAFDCSEWTDNRSKAKVDFDSGFGTKPSANTRSSSRSRRSTRVRKLRRTTQTEKVTKKCRKTANKVSNPPGTIEPFFNSATGKRSCFSKPARSSIWGLMGNISLVFGQNNQLAVKEVQYQGSRKERDGRGNNDLEAGSSGPSKEKVHASTSRIRLKVRVGKETDFSSVKVMVPEVVDTSVPAIIRNNRHEMHKGTSLKFFKSANGLEDKLGIEMPGSRHIESINRSQEKVNTDASNRGRHLADDDLDSTAFLDKSSGNCADVCLGISSKIEVDSLGGAIENRYLDPGTSPDSEVINLIPDAQIGARVQEDMHDTRLSSSQDLVASGNVTGSKLSRMNSKKGRKKEKVPWSGNCIVDPLTGLASTSKPRLLEKCGSRQKTRDGFYSDETLTSSTSGFASSNTLSSKELSSELLPSSKETKLGESGVEANLYINPNIGLGSSESQNFEKLLPSTKAKGDKLSRNSKSSEASMCRSEVPDLGRSWWGDACRQKSVCKSQVKEKGVCDQVVHEVESHQETCTGMYAVDDNGETNTGDEPMPDKKCNLDMVSNVVEQCLSPRNAWVCCDECHKWRRIPATLADSISETNCKWTCEENMDLAFADCSIPQEMSNAEINAELGISDASGEEDANDDHLKSKRLERKRSTVAQPSSWILIKSNLYLYRKRKNQTIDEVMVCTCKPGRDGRLGCGDECLNRMLNIECVRGYCPCGDRCTNQQFQKRKYAKLKWFRCGKKGYGLQLVENIYKGQFLIEYVGEVLDLHAYEGRQKEYASRGHKHFYFMTLDSNEVIDACAKGNLGRFINHSCDPNCRTEKWMVNGEICIGLFALRDIKKGEEVTFDYNYVRVFGAAAKECVCGSLQCRGSIGGDPNNTEVIVQGDSDEEFPEPVMVLQDGETCEGLDNTLSTTPFDDRDTKITKASNNRDIIDKPASAVGQLEITTENEDSLNRSASAVTQLQISLEMEDSIENIPSSVPPVENFLHIEDVTSKPICSVQQEFALEEETKNKSFSVKKLETSLIPVLSKPLYDTADAKRAFKSATVEDSQIPSRPRPLMKTSRSSSSVKKAKHKSSPSVANKSQVLPNKPRKLLELSANGRFEAVQEKLNELLDAEGGITKRKDAPKGYLKLLLLTVASGGRGNGEAIQSNRDLSMILDALLKTKSRATLTDIINKNGLRMLHNIMKQYRSDFNKIPILRKLLKVLEYLAEKEILTLEHIHEGPPCPGMESFRESMLTLTEHIDKQVHQIARSFRDKWYPRQRVGCIDRDDGRKGNRYSGSESYRSDRVVKPNDSPMEESGNVNSPVVAGTQENGTKVRKRKSRWDQPEKSHSELSSPHRKEQKVKPHECESNPDASREDDIPPGFSPLASLVPSSKKVTGHPQERFINRLPVSYGIPLCIVEQHGTRREGSVEGWAIAPGMPFHPFPPLPPCPRDRRIHHPSPSTMSHHHQQRGEVPRGSATCQNTPSTSGTIPPPPPNMDHENNQFKRARGGSGQPDLGTKYFRQSKLPVPWIRKRSGWGNNSRSGMYNPGVANVAGNGGLQSNGNTFYHHHHHHH